MSEPVPVLVTLHVWRVADRQVPAAVLRMALDRRQVRRLTGLRFGKLLGTGDGRRFTVRAADPTHWALLCAWSGRDSADAFERSAVARNWRRIAAERWRVDLRPLSARGQWSGREPFGRPETARWEGPVAALTRARISPRRLVRFWRAVPPVAADLQQRPGLLATLGVGEAPVGVQGTFSLWDSAEALRDFAYRRPAHQTAIRRTAEERWYAEELFARFAVVGSAGTLFGADPLA
ncbi:MAG: monooxygenase [Actinomycetota bacterium]|nr:monooxygenase [Actinomycetota bacterium]